MNLRVLLLPALALAVGGCSGPPSAGRQLGDDLGGFLVSANELTNGCGAGALGSKRRFDFEIDLARDHSQIFWGRAASSFLDARLGFEFLATVRVPVVEPSPKLEGCTIGRADRITGTLEADVNGEVLGFSAQMTHAFEASPDSECSIDDRSGAGLPRLPCEMEYALTAERSREPD